MPGVLSTRAVCSAAIAVAVLAVAPPGCSGQTAPPPTDYDHCMALCEAYPDLGCTFESAEHQSPIANVVSGFYCHEWCLELEEPGSPLDEACRLSHKPLIACAAEAGLECVPGAPDAAPIVRGCDDSARAAAAPCRSCVLLPSSHGPESGCPAARPMRWHCPVDLQSSSTWPTCSPACTLVGEREFCCAESHWKAGCDPEATPMCSGC